MRIVTAEEAEEAGTAGKRRRTVGRGAGEVEEAGTCSWGGGRDRHHVSGL